MSNSKPLNPWKITGYRAGQSIACKVMATEPGGYAVIIPKDSLPGFLPTEEKLKIGEEVLAQFVCVANNRILLAKRFAPAAANAAGEVKSTPKVNWQQQLSDNPPEGDAAFNVWAQTHPKKFQLKRATDLICPPIDDKQPTLFNMGEHDLEWLITDLEGGMRTGCIKASSEEKLSRSAALLYKGRAVGCIYGSKSMFDTHPTEPSLSLMMSDMALPSTKVMVYDLPEDLTLAMSALFLGYPVNRSDDLDARSFMDYLCGWFADKGQTACMAFSLPSKTATCLSFIHNGKYVGAFYVEDQTYSTDKNFVYELLQNDPQASVEASILPPEMTTSSVRFGYSLSMARKAIK